MIGSLNINSLRYKIIDLRQILSCAPLEVLAVNETKLSDQFPDSQFIVDGYYNSGQFRKDRNEYGGGIFFVFVKMVSLQNASGLSNKKLLNQPALK